MSKLYLDYSHFIQTLKRTQHCEVFLKKIVCRIKRKLDSLTPKLHRQTKTELTVWRLIVY